MVFKTVSSPRLWTSRTALGPPVYYTGDLWFYEFFVGLVFDELILRESFLATRTVGLFELVRDLYLL